MNISTEALILMIKSDESAAKFNSIDEYRKHLNKFIQFCDLVDKANGVDSENKALHKHIVSNNEVAVCQHKPKSLGRMIQCEICGEILSSF